MDNQKEYRYLTNINSPQDLRKLKTEDLPEVCQELRKDIINELSHNPGHFASSLGVVELTVALHYVFDTTESSGMWAIRHTGTKS